MVKGSFVATVRHELWTETNWHCSYCGKSMLIEGEDGIYTPNYRDMTLDHIVPRAQGGPTQKPNLRPSCRKCNNLKADHSIEKFRKRFFNGRRDPRFAYERWEDHLAEVET